ncbi:MAG: MFS transporter [Candidatus Lokiarchaeota archaeon]|nr:MFS transporter [Candidatus Lokiarchaeota archaeon]MBD3340754.1 MFS transporter [Candidatus Lokiarchaeota archaeon]
MQEKYAMINKKSEEGYSSKKAVAFSFGQVADVTAYQSFVFLVFTFYFTIIGLPVLFISLGFMIWSVWNAINDPMLGYISDRTHTRFGRRLPYIMAGLIPLAIVMFFVFSPPKTFGITNLMVNLVYFIIIIIVFELFYTMMSINLTSLFPEAFISLEERTKANNIRQTFTVVALLFAFILPGFIISDYSDPQYIVQYSIFGAAVTVIVLITGFLFLKFGPKEKKEFQEDYKNAPNFLNSIKMCVKSKSFRWYIPAEIAMWFIFSMVPTIIPLYAKFVLGMENALLISIMLGLTFISAMIFINILWRPMVQKVGPRKAWIYAMIIWIGTNIPLLFISDPISGFIFFFFLGIGFGGGLYIIDIVVADIVDEDEVQTGMRREAGYYGVNALFLRFTTILVFLAISLVFTNVGWAVYEPDKVTIQVLIGLRILIAVFPTIALLIGIFAMYKYPLHGERLTKVKEELEKIHTEKKSRIIK